MQSNSPRRDENQRGGGTGISGPPALKKLVEAVQSRDKEAVQALLGDNKVTEEELNGLFRAQNEPFERSVLHVACTEKSWDLAELLVQAKAPSPPLLQPFAILYCQNSQTFFTYDGLFFLLLLLGPSELTRWRGQHSFFVCNKSRCTAYNSSNNGGSWSGYHHLEHHVPNCYLPCNRSQSHSLLVAAS